MPRGSLIGLTVGDRVRLARPVERYPHFVAPAGMLGTVVEVAPDVVSVRMDEPLANCAEWENEIVWADDRLADFPADVWTVV